MKALMKAAKLAIKEERYSDAVEHCQVGDYRAHRLVPTLSHFTR
jgi:hypothetical protein